jgi:hypothetical protein
MSAWGAQGGKKGGTYLPNPGSATQVGGTPWVYTQSPGSSRELGGTAPGGWVITPPEVDISDIDDTFAPTGLTLSPTYFATAPGASFGAGTPELATGGLMNGWSWTISGTALVFYGHSSTGVKTEYLRFNAASGMVGSNGFVVGGGSSQTVRLQTGSGNVVAGESVIVDSGGGASTATLPASPADGDFIEVKRTGASNVTIARNGKLIENAAADYTLAADKQSLSLRYDTGTGSWWIF